MDSLHSFPVGLLHPLQHAGFIPALSEYCPSSAADGIHRARISESLAHFGLLCVVFVPRALILSRFWPAQSVSSLIGFSKLCQSLSVHTQQRGMVGYTVW